MSYLWAVGAGLGVIGSVFSNLGVNVQKYSFMQTAKLPPELRKPYFRNVGWWLGLALVVLGALGDFVALGIAAQSIVAPIGAMTLVANVFFAHYWLKESLPKKDLAATACIVVGSVVCAVMGDHTETAYSMEQLLEFYSAPGFIAYALFVVLFIVVLYSIAKHIEPLKKNLNAAIRAFEDAKNAGASMVSSLTSLDEKIFAAEAEYVKWERVHPFTYCAISGAFGGQNILFGKMVAELLARSIKGDNQMKYALTYVFLVCMFGSIGCQLHFLAKALSSFDALYCVPVFQCFFIVFSTLAGAAYFAEFSRFSLTQALIFPLGMILTLGGVGILSNRQMRANHVAQKPEEQEPVPEEPMPKIMHERRKSNYASGRKGSLYRFQSLEIVGDIPAPLASPGLAHLNYGLLRVASLGHASFDYNKAERDKPVASRPSVGNSQDQASNGNSQSEGRRASDASQSQGFPDQEEGNGTPKLPHTPEEGKLTDADELP